MSLPNKDYITIRMQGNDLYRTLTDSKKGKGPVYTKEILAKKFPVLAKESKLFFNYLCDPKPNILLFNAILRLMQAIKTEKIELLKGQDYLSSITFYMMMTDKVKREEIEKEKGLSLDDILNWIEDNC